MPELGSTGQCQFRIMEEPTCAQRTMALDSNEAYDVERGFASRCFHESTGMIDTSMIFSVSVVLRSEDDKGSIF